MKTVQKTTRRKPISPDRICDKCGKVQRKPIPRDDFKGYVCSKCLEADISRLSRVISEMAGMNIPSVVCLCGSSRFSAAFHDANLRESLDGKIVLSIGSDVFSDKELRLSEEQTGQLVDLHFRKIDLADEVLILNVDGYIGEATQRELDYAIFKKKKIRYLEDLVNA